MTLFLVNGVMLQGRSRPSTNSALLLERGGQIQLVYKHAISTLQPEHALNLERERSRATKRRTRRLNKFDGNGAIEVARGERALIVVPRAARARARGARPKRASRRPKGWPRRSASVVAGERAFRLRAVRPATLLGKGQVEEVAALARRA